MKKENEELKARLEQAQREIEQYRKVNNYFYCLFIY